MGLNRSLDGDFKRWVGLDRARGGLAALLTTDGPEKNTIQYSADGINFEIMAVLKGAPEAMGLFRGLDNDKGPLEGISWGLCHQYDASWQWQSIRRFECYFPYRI
jgi:hypothetical protein